MDLNNFKEMDPFILLSIINLKLRDYYNSLEILGEDLNINIVDLKEKLKECGYIYNKSTNQFVAK